MGARGEALAWRKGARSLTLVIYIYICVNIYVNICEYIMCIVFTCSISKRTQPYIFR